MTRHDLANLLRMIDRGIGFFVPGDTAEQQVAVLQLVSIVCSIASLLCLVAGC